jgi:hypothetical protein
MLKNEYLVAKIGVDTAENGPTFESMARADSRAEGFFGALVQARVVMLRAVVVLELRKSTAMVWLFRHFLDEGKRKWKSLMLSSGLSIEGEDKRPDMKNHQWSSATERWCRRTTG